MTGERRALSSLILAFYFINFLMNALMGGGPTTAVMYALAGVYGLAFLGVVAGYFWARWYAMGVNLFGVIIGAVGLWQLGPEPVMIFFCGTHLVATLALWGTSMSALYDGQTAWRERFHMDDSAVQRLGRSVIRAGLSLPIVLAYGLMPKTAGGLALIAVATLGFAALLRLRTWGVLALGAGAAMTVAASTHVAFVNGTAIAIPGILVTVLLASAVLPFVGPMRQFVARR